MNLKKIIYSFVGISLLMTMGGMLTNVPVFKTGTFSEDGNYFAYTYTPEIEKPDVDGSITMRGFGYPTYFQVMETATGKRLVDNPYNTNPSTR